MMNESALPMELHISKSYYQKRILGCVGLIVLFIVGFWWGSGKFFTEDYYYPKMVVIMPLGIIAMVVLLIQAAIRLKSNKRVARLDKQGIQLYDKPFSAVGLIRWQDVVAFQEIAEGRTGRNFFLGVKNPEVYIENIQSANQRRKMKKFQKDNNALVFLNTAMLNVNPTTLKTAVTNAIADIQSNARNNGNIVPKSSYSF
jgi:uncharacterized membrane-anchored protein